MGRLAQSLDNPQINIGKRVKDMIGHRNDICRIAETAIEQKSKRRCVAVILMQHVDRDVANLKLLAGGNLPRDHRRHKIGRRFSLFLEQIGKSGDNVLRMPRCCMNGHLDTVGKEKGTKIVQPGNMVGMGVGNQQRINPV